ncbi:GNAT family N-acetyltransferase [Asticcacaulis sp. BYS171W]|uniref:GNAT family N-acetyltransferase n=1 Tax=Asticcacaulis aquaticus TaxID=2984212 RepID=A0ABT5HRQ8_9CAUL|nr:GNAT family N-acetyltransferase [Asticcacaulis aquaticus]MDC7682757.1 GNAT family N-acetyltransferase [Asticcacaulis aquaticus]
MAEFLSYRPITPDDAMLLLDWRTAPHITRYMLTDVPYDIERQKAWIERSNARDDYHHRIIQIHGKDVGFCSLTVTDKANQIGEVGVYIGDPEVPVALSMYNFLGTLNHAFFTLGLHKLVNHVVDWNDRVIRTQAFIGYRHVGVLKNHALKDGVRHDLHIFEQEASEWAAFRKKFRDTRDWDGNETI